MTHGQPQDSCEDAQRVFLHALRVCSRAYKQLDPDQRMLWTSQQRFVAGIVETALRHMGKA